MMILLHDGHESEPCPLAEPFHWCQPRKVSDRWWMELHWYCRSDGTFYPEDHRAHCNDGILLVRGGRVQWAVHGQSPYAIDISCEREGIGLWCWPSFQALADAQSMVETLIVLPTAAILARHGIDWQRVIPTASLQGNTDAHDLYRWVCHLDTGAASG